MFFRLKLELKLTICFNSDIMRKVMVLMFSHMGLCFLQQFELKSIETGDVTLMLTSPLEIQVLCSFLTMLDVSG